MTPEISRSRLIPGLSARMWARILFWARVGILGLYLIIALAEFVIAPSGILAVVGFGVCLFAFVLSIPFQIMRFTGLPKERAEVRAGYTTLTYKYGSLDQLDPKTGAVVRAAGRPFVTSRSRKQFATSDNSRRPSRRDRTILFTLLGVVLGAGFSELILWRFVGHQELPLVAGVYGGVAVLIAAAYAIGILRRMAGMRRAQAVAPDDFVFRFRIWSDYVASAEQLFSGPAGEPNRAVHGLGVVSASSTGITIWEGAPPTQVAAYDWESVIAIQTTTTAVADRTYPTLAIAIRKRGAELVWLPFLNPTHRWTRTRTSRPEVDWIVSELEDIRSSPATAQVL
jgi:hypothetical protein